MPVNGLSVLALIPARGGSTELPGKNIRPFAGLPLIVHSILCAASTSVDGIVVSTDSEEIAEVARKWGAETPFMRPAELAQDDTPIWPVIQHAVKECPGYDLLALFEPTSPLRQPEDLAGCVERLALDPGTGIAGIDGVVTVSRPDFVPEFACVRELPSGTLYPMAGRKPYDRLQDAPKTFRINGSMYVWRTSFINASGDHHWIHSRLLGYETPEFRSLSIDTLEQFERGEKMVRAGIVSLPWLAAVGV